MCIQYSTDPLLVCIDYVCGIKINCCIDLYSLLQPKPREHAYLQLQCNFVTVASDV